MIKCKQVFTSCITFLWTCIQMLINLHNSTRPCLQALILVCRLVWLYTCMLVCLHEYIPNLTWLKDGHPTLKSKGKVYLSECGSCRPLVGWNLVISGWWWPSLGDGLAAITQRWSPSSTYQQLLTHWWVTDEEGHSRGLIWWSKNCRNGAVSGSRNCKNTAVSRSRNCEYGPKNFWIHKL